LMTINKLIVAAICLSGIAVSLASGVAVPMSLLSGAMFPLPEMPVGSLAGHTVEAFDFLPTAHAVEAMRREAVDLSLAAAAKLIQQRLEGEADRKIVEDYLSSVGEKR